jgi:hypothetical protein
MTRHVARIPPFQPTPGQGSMTPPTRDNQGHLVDPPVFERMEIPGFPWENPDPVVKLGSESWMGISIDSYQERQESWLADLEKLIREYWSFSRVDIKKSRNTLDVSVTSLSKTFTFEVSGPVNANAFVAGELLKFDKTSNLRDILMTIDKHLRVSGRIASSSSPKDELRSCAVDLSAIALELLRLDEKLSEVALLLRAPTQDTGESLADIYREADDVSRQLSRLEVGKLAHQLRKMALTLKV